MSFPSAYYRLPGYRASVNILPMPFKLVNLANAQAKLRALRIHPTRAVSFSLLLGSNLLSGCQRDYIFHTQTVDVRGFDFDKR